ncbi:hypothetical protein B484DRAFT_398467 [Ochromonadaceae sp. CCMP2298]|nr:hypothetical protein B484DRAFT_398467 [Ochromonadaceae sp. CCMP2298]
MSAASAAVPVDDGGIPLDDADGLNDPKDQHPQAVGGAVTYLFDVDELERIEEGTDLVVFLKAVPTGRTNAHRGWVLNRVLKVLKNHELIPEAAPPTFGALNANGERTFWKVLSEQRKEDVPVLWREPVEVAINRKEPALEAASGDTGSVVVNSWVRFHTKVPAADRTDVLTGGVSLSRGVVLEELMEWTRVVAAEVSNLLKVEHPQLSNIHPELGVFNTTLELDEMITSSKSKFDVIFYQLDKSGRQESGEILDATALHFCKAGRTLNTVLFYQWLLWKDENLTFLSNALPTGVGMASGFSCPWVTAVPPPAGGAAAARGPGQAAVPSARASKEAAAEKTAAAHTQAVVGAITAVMESGSKRAMMSPDSKERKKQRELATINAAEAQAAFLQQSMRIADKAQQISELRATIFHVSFNGMPEEFKQRLMDRLEALLLG